MYVSFVKSDMDRLAFSWQWVGYTHPKSIINLHSENQTIVQSRFLYLCKKTCILQGYESQKQILIQHKSKWYRVDLIVVCYNLDNPALHYKEYITSLWCA